MTYRISGLAPDLIDRFRHLDDAELERLGARRVIADADHGYPCRASLRDAAKGEALILFNHVSHDVATPYRSAYAIFIRENAEQVELAPEEIPPVFEGRPLALRHFSADGMLKSASLAAPGEADVKLREAFDDARIAYVDVHNAAHGCFAARAERA